MNQEFLFAVYEEFKQRMTKDNLEIGYEVYSNNKPLLYFAHPSLSKDKNNWILRKRNVVETFGQSSKEIAEKNNNNLENFSLKYGYSSKDFALVAGAVPIRDTNNVIVGTLTVTGLAPDEDHQLALDVLEAVNNK